MLNDYVTGHPLLICTPLLKSLDTFAAWLQAWVSHTSDPLISPGAQAVVAAIAAHPACLPSLAAAAAPTLAGILSNGAAARQAKRQGLQPAAAAGGEAPMLLEASLDLLGTLLQPNQPAVAIEVRIYARPCSC
jgi:hypothetical protein